MKTIKSAAITKFQIGKDSRPEYIAIAPNITMMQALITGGSNPERSA